MRALQAHYERQCEALQAETSRAREEAVDAMVQLQVARGAQGRQDLRAETEAENTQREYGRFVWEREATAREVADLRTQLEHAQARLFADEARVATAEQSVQEAERARGAVCPAPPSFHPLPHGLDT